MLLIKYMLVTVGFEDISLPLTLWSK